MVGLHDGRGVAGGAQELVELLVVGSRAFLLETLDHGRCSESVKVAMGALLGVDGVEVTPGGGWNPLGTQRDVAVIARLEGFND